MDYKSNILEIGSKIKLEDALTVDKVSNYVGIGTTSPGHKLDVNGTARVGNYLTFTTGTSIPSAAISYYTNGYLYIKGGGSGAVIGDDSLATSMYCIDNGNIEFNTAGTGTKMVITGGGNVGIGETNPFGKLNVSRAGINEGTISFDDQANNAHLVLAGTDSLVRMQLGTYNNGSFGAWIQGSYDNGGIDYGTVPLIFNPQGGNVGIGTTSPGHKLDVRGSGYFLGDTSVPNAPVDLGFYLGKSQTDENRRLEIVSPENGVSYIDFTKPNVDYRGRIAYYDNGDSFRFYTAGSEKLRIDSSGNVGIGITSPSARLDIASLAGGNDEKLQRWTYYAPSPSDYYLDLKQTVTPGVVRYNFSMVNNSIAYNNVLVLDRGNVGIGTDNPGAKLHIGPSLNTTPASTSVNIQGDTSIRFNGGSDGNANYGSYIVSDQSSGYRRLNFGTRYAGIDTLAMTVDRGNVGIGDTGPVVKLQVSTNSPTNNVAALIGDGWVGNSDYHKEGGLLLVSGTSQDSTQTGAGIAFQTRNTANTNYWKSSVIMDRDGAIRFTLGGAGTTAGSEDFTILSNGNVGIGTTGPGQKLQVDGNLLVNAGTSAAAYRDIMMGGIGGWATGESHGIDTVYNTAASPTTFSRIESYFDGTNGKMRFRNLFNANSPRTDILMTIQGNGNVGIGTDDPGDALVVKGGSPGNIDLVSFQNNAGNETHRFYTDSANDGVIETVTNAGVTANLIQSSGNSYFNGGNVGIGETNPAEKLHVSGPVVINGGTISSSTDSTLYITADSNTDWGLKIDAVSGKTEYGQTIEMPASFNYGFQLKKNGFEHFLINDVGAKISGNYIWHAGNDGSGSGLDADLLDGQHASAFALSSHNHDDRYYTETESDNRFVNVTGDTMTGRLTMSAGNESQPIQITGSNSSYTAISINNTSGGNAGIYIDAINGDLSGSDYVFIGQNDSGYAEYNIGTSSPMPYHVFTGGNVGINETNPSQKLHVNGNARVTGFYYDSTNSAGTPGYVLSSTSGGTEWVTADSVISYKWYAVSDGGLASASISNSTSLDFQGGTGISTSTSGSGSAYTIEFTNTDRGSAQNIFKNVAGPTGQPTIVAASNNDTVTLKDDRFITITTNNSTKTAQFSPKALEVCDFLLAFKSPSAQTNYLVWVNGSYQSTTGLETYKTALYAGEIDVVKIISDVTVSGVYIDVYETGAPTTPIWSSGSTNLTANTLMSFSPSGATFSSSDQLYATIAIPTSATVVYRLDFGLLYS